MAKFKVHIPWGYVLYFIYLIGGIVGVVLLMGAVQVKSSEQACTEFRIQIKGDDAFVEKEDVARLIETEYGKMVGRTLESLPIHDMEANLKRIPYVEHAQVSMDMNGLLLVKVSQRRAVLRIIDEEGNGFYVDENRLKMPVSSRYVPSVTLANGNIEESYGRALEEINSSLVQDLYSIADYLDQNEVWQEQIVQLFVNEQGEIELIPRVGDQRIIFGDASDLTQKFEKLLIYYQGIVPKMGLDAYEVVNLKYKDQLVCLQRNAMSKKVQEFAPADTVKINMDTNSTRLDSIIKVNNTTLNIE
jgi:cell division protein FtsQ